MRSLTIDEIGEIQGGLRVLRILRDGVIYEAIRSGASYVLTAIRNYDGERDAGDYFDSLPPGMQ